MTIKFPHSADMQVIILHSVHFKLKWQFISANDRQLSPPVTKMVPMVEGALNRVEQFTDNWRKQVTVYIDGYAAENNTALGVLAKEQKTELVGQSYNPWPI